MKRPVLVLLSLALLLPAYSHALDLPFTGGGKKDAGDEAVVKKGEARFQVRFKTGGVLEVDNYTVTENHVIVMMPSGAIYLDKKMVSSIDEVKGPEDETVQTIKVGSEPPPPPVPSERPRKEVPMPDTSKADTTPRDDEGHTEAWWRSRVNKHQQQKSDAEKRHSDAESDWNRYNGQLNNLGPDSPEYERTRLQDLRGSARVSMDRAQAEMAEADRMLDEVLPDEARKAGAPPGWVR